MLAFIRASLTALPFVATFFDAETVADQQADKFFPVHQAHGHGQ